jgi:hypothetical protein
MYQCQWRDGNVRFCGIDCEIADDQTSWTKILEVEFEMNSINFGRNAIVWKMWPFIGQNMSLRQFQKVNRFVPEKCTTGRWTVSDFDCRMVRDMEKIGRQMTTHTWQWADLETWEGGRRTRVREMCYMWADHRRPRTRQRKKKTNRREDQRNGQWRKTKSTKTRTEANRNNSNKDKGTIKQYQQR